MNTGVAPLIGLEYTANLPIFGFTILPLHILYIKNTLQYNMPFPSSYHNPFNTPNFRMTPRVRVYPHIENSGYSYVSE